MVLTYFYLLERPYVWWRRWRMRRAWRRLVRLLTVPLYEIKSANYDAETMSRRLQSLEGQDLQVASIAFGLLRLNHCNTSTAALMRADGT